MVQPSHPLCLYCVFKAGTNPLELIKASLVLLMYEGNWILEPYSMCTKSLKFAGKKRQSHWAQWETTMPTMVNNSVAEIQLR